METILETNKFRKGQNALTVNKLFGEKTFEMNNGLQKDNPYYKIFSRDEHASLRKFYKYMKAFDTNVGDSRRALIIQRLYLLRKNGVKQFLTDISKDNIADVLSEITTMDVAATTKQGFRQALRKYLLWREYGMDLKQRIILEGYPLVVRLIPNGVLKNEKRKVNTHETLTREELAKMINCATTVRNKAVICMLIETGARIGELENIRVKDLKYVATPPRFIIDLTGKTGHRQTMIVEYFRYVNEWISQHPLRGTKNFKEQPLFVVNGRTVGEYRALGYNAINHLLRRTAQYAGITKPVNPHNFRHTWVTHKDQEGWSISEIANSVGWSKNSKQFGNYSHTDSKTSMAKRLESIGAVRKVYKSTNVTCKNPDCLAVNSKVDTTCWQCNQPLDSANRKIFGKSDTMEDRIVEKLLRALAPKGLIEKDATYNTVVGETYQIGDRL